MEGGALACLPCFIICNGVSLFHRPFNELDRSRVGPVIPPQFLFSLNYPSSSTRLLPPPQRAVCDGRSGRTATRDGRTERQRAVNGGRRRRSAIYEGRQFYSSLIPALLHVSLSHVGDKHQREVSDAFNAVRVPK